MQPSETSSPESHPQSSLFLSHSGGLRAVSLPAWAQKENITAKAAHIYCTLRNRTVFGVVGKRISRRLYHIRIQPRATTSRTALRDHQIGNAANFSKPNRAIPTPLKANFIDLTCRRLCPLTSAIDNLDFYHPFSPHLSHTLPVRTDSRRGGCGAEAGAESGNQYGGASRFRHYGVDAIRHSERR